MAYKDSEELKTNERYPLGDYSFRIERSSVPGSTNDKIEAICTDKDGKNARKSIQVPSSTKINGWYVEANETEATVYAVISEKKTPGGDPRDVDLSEVGSMQYSYGPWGNRYWPNIIVWADFPARVFFSGLDAQTSSPITLSYDAAKDIYFGNIDINGNNPSPIYGPATLDGYTLVPQGHASEEVEKTLLVGRFAIDLGDAGGVGPGSDWTDPGDYDDEEDLYVKLDKNEGRAGETFVASITGHDQESMTVTVQDSNGIIKETYYVPSPAAKEDTATVTIRTDMSWLPGDNYSESYIVEVMTNSTLRTASDYFFIEKDWLDVSVEPWDGKPEDVLTATVSGHNGTRVSGVVKNSADETVLTISPITPQDAETDVTFDITLNDEWFSDEETFCESLLLVVTSEDGQTAEAGFSMYKDPEDPEEDLYIELDEYYGAPGDTFTASITGHRLETMTLTVTNSEDTVMATYSIPAQEEKTDVATQLIQTAGSWMPDGVYDAGFTATVETDATGRTASAGFTLSVEEPQILSIQVYPYEGMPGDILTATVEGHNGTSVSAVIKNSAGETIHSYSAVTPEDAQTAVEFAIELDRAWISQEDCYCEAFLIIATSGDGQEASDGFSIVIEEPPPKTLYLSVTGASSGTHQSGGYPIPNSKVAWYGCGGDGGHGGGGGAGASTVVVYRFATDKANNKEITAIAKQPGTGSGGGAGGKGGDGCILVYY